MRLEFEFKIGPGGRGRPRMRERAEFVLAVGFAFAVCYCAGEPGAPRGGLIACALLCKERLKKGGDIIISADGRPG